MTVVDEFYVVIIETVPGAEEERENGPEAAGKSFRSIRRVYGSLYEIVDEKRNEQLQDEKKLAGAV